VLLKLNWPVKSSPHTASLDIRTTASIVVSYSFAVAKISRFSKEVEQPRCHVRLETRSVWGGPRVGTVANRSFSRKF